MCSSWFVSVCAAEVCAINVCAMSVGSGVGRLRAVVVCARAVRAVAPGEGRCDSICERRCVSSSFLVSWVRLLGPLH